MKRYKMTPHLLAVLLIEMPADATEEELNRLINLAFADIDVA